jgi:hypothetical protein
MLDRGLLVCLHVRQPVLARGARALVARGLSRVRMGSCCNDDPSGVKVSSIACMDEVQLGDASFADGSGYFPV